MKTSDTTLSAIDGTDLHLRSWVPSGASAQLVLVHGVSEHAGRYEHVARFFAERGFAVHAHDHRGHGLSGGPRLDVDRFDQYLDDLTLVVGRVHRSDRPLVVYGHSMGGLIATLHAESDRLQPDLYVLSAPALDAAASALLRAAAKVLSRVAGGIRLGTGIRGDQLSRDPAVGEAYFADPLVHLEGTARFGGTLLDAMRRARDSVSAISVPTLVIHGTDDTVVPPSASAPLAAAPAVERKLFPGLRHELHNEPEQNEVLRFVAGWIENSLGDQSAA